MTKDEALALALEALESSRIFVTTREKTKHPEGTEWYDSAITALREALAQPEQEPVAYYHPHKGFYWAKPTSISAPTVVDVPPVPLYTAPSQRPWQGLTDEEIWSADPRIGTSDSNVNPHQILINARAIEAKLKQRNHG